MNGNWRRIIIPVVILPFLLNMAGLQGLNGQEIILRKGDRLELKVENRRELDRQLVLDESGQVTIPVVGEIRLEGLLLEEARNLILERLRETYPSVSSLDVNLYGEESRRLIYVQGEVIRPGRYGFMEPPNVWEAIREAGGASPRAALGAVRIIHGEGEDRQTEIINLQEVIDSGNFASLPRLKVGDTVFVPETESRIRAEDAVKILGAVANPGSFNLQDNNRLEDVIIAAGGVSDNADLKDIRIIRKIPGGKVITVKVDFTEYLDEGVLENNPMVYPGDMVNVPRRSNVLRELFTNPGYVIGILTASMTLLAILLR